jgi:hypothetical protein
MSPTVKIWNQSLHVDKRGEWECKVGEGDPIRVIFFIHLNTRKHQEKILTSIGRKIQELFWMNEPNVNHEL